MNVKLISVSPDAEKLMAYCARVSSPEQDKHDYAKLLRYCIEHGHWSVFETASMVLEIETSRAIAAQILRHRSFSFQEFSQRYAAVANGGFELYEARRQDTKNRQNSIDDLSPAVKEWFEAAQQSVWAQSVELYEKALDKGIAKECARFLLPLNTRTRLYMHGTVRSWIHYLQVRDADGVQAEHRKIASAVKREFCAQFPTCAVALGWTERDPLRTQGNDDGFKPGEASTWEIVNHASRAANALPDLFDIRHDEDAGTLVGLDEKEVDEKPSSILEPDINLFFPDTSSGRQVWRLDETGNKVHNVEVVPDSKFEPGDAVGLTHDGLGFKPGRDE